MNLKPAEKKLVIIVLFLIFQNLAVAQLYEDPYFLIRNRKSEKVFRPCNEMEGTKIIQTYMNTESDWGQWVVTPNEEGFVEFKNKATGKYLCPSLIKGMDDIVQTSVPGSSWTQWKKFPADEGYVYLVNRETGLPLTAWNMVDQQKEENASIYQHPERHAKDWRQWQIIPRSKAEMGNPEFYLPVKNGTMEEGGIKAYPNPFFNEINLVSFEREPIQAFQLLDFSGKVIYQETGLEINHRKLRIPEELPSGFYAVRIVTSAYKKTFQLLKGH